MAIMREVHCHSEKAREQLWKADSGNKVTWPVGIGVGRTFKIGSHAFKVDGQVSYAVIHPDDFGQRWGFRVRFSPIINALCCTGTIF